MLELIEQSNNKMKKIVNNAFIHGFTPHLKHGSEKIIGEITFRLSPINDISIDAIKEFQSLIQEILPNTSIVSSNRAGQQTFKIKMDSVNYDDR